LGFRVAFMAPPSFSQRWRALTVGAPGWCLSTARIFKLRHYQLRLRRQNILTVRGVPSPIILLSAAHLMTDSTC